MAKAATTSATESALFKHSYLHPEGKQRRHQQHQQQNLQLSNMIAHFLGESKGINNINKEICSCQA